MVLRTVVYLLLSAIMLLSGISFIRGTGACKDGCGRPRRRSIMEMLLSRSGRRSTRGEGFFMFGAGTLVSTVCVSEASAAVLATASYLGIEMDSIPGGALVGAISMFAYSIGLTVPLIALGALSSEMGRRMQRDDVRKVGGLLLCLFGGGLMVLTLISLLL
jgi:cytochrome c biogenesis protein CcdA